MFFLNIHKITTIKKIRPNNTEIKAKIRQQMQVLKHHEMVEFVNNNGVYRLLMAL